MARLKVRRFWLVRLLGAFAALLLRWWLSTLRYRVASLDRRSHPADPSRERFLYPFWHESLLAPAIIRTKVYVMISHHADGEFIAQVCQRLGFGVVRGSTTRGGTEALLELVRCSRSSHLAMTPDGPKGPRRRVQLGTIFLASRTGLPIVPLGVGFGRAWRAHSWDRFAVPAPWSTVTGVVGRPIAIPANLNRSEMEQYRQLVETEMLRLTTAAERWATGSASRAA